MKLAALLSVLMIVVCSCSQRVDPIRTAYKKHYVKNEARKAVPRFIVGFFVGYTFIPAVININRWR